MADVNFEIRGLKSFRTYLRQLSGGFESQQLMAEIGMFVISRIKLRTAEGEDVFGDSFEPYSDSYAFFRASKGLRIEEVDLFFTGSMMSSMSYEASSDKVKVYFLNTEDKTGTKNPNKAAWLNEKREFFALSDDDIDDIEGLVDDFITRELEL